MRKKISTATLIEMYSQNMSTPSIAKIVGMSSSGVTWRLRQAGVVLRDRHCPLSTDEIVRMYIGDKLSSGAIAKMTGVPSNTILSRLRRAGIELRDGVRNPISDEELHRMYFDQGNSPIDIGRQVGLTYGAVCKRLRNAGYELRHAGNGRFLDPVRAPMGHPTVADIIWASGIYEGEGSCIDRTGTFRSPIVNLAQKDRWLCDRLRSLFGGSVARYQHSRNENQYYYWKLSGMRARGFLMTIYRFLSPRRQERIRQALGIDRVIKAA